MTSGIDATMGSHLHFQEGPSMPEVGVSMRESPASPILTTHRGISLTPNSPPLPQRGIITHPDHQQATNSFESLISGMENMCQTLTPVLESVRVRALSPACGLTPVLENSYTDLPNNLEGSECPSTSPLDSGCGNFFSIDLPVDTNHESPFLLAELARVISEERRLHEDSLVAACEVLREEARKVLIEIERAGTIVHRRIQEETVPAACDVLQSEVEKAIIVLKNEVKICHTESDALSAEADKVIANLPETMGSGMLSSTKDDKHTMVFAGAQNAVSEIIDQAHRLQKDLIQAELTKAISQLKEVASESAKSLAEAVPRERNILQSESEKENHLHQAAFLKGIAQQTESEARLEQHWSNLVQEEVARGVTFSLTDFERRLAMLEISGGSSSSQDFHQNEFTRLSTLEAQVQAALSFGTKAASLEERTASLEQQVQESVARAPFEARMESLEQQVRVALASTTSAASLEARTASLEQQMQQSMARVPLEARLESLEQQVQASVPSASMPLTSEDVQNLRTEDVSLLVAEMIKWRPMIQDVSRLHGNMKKLRDLLLPDQIKEIRSEVTKLQDVLFPEQIKEVKSLVEEERLQRNLALQDEATKYAMAHEKLQSMVDVVSGMQTKFGNDIGKLQEAMEKL